MPFDSALNATQLAYLRGNATTPRAHQAAVYLSAVPNTVVYSARVNQASFTYPLAELTYDGGSGTLADVQVGMTVLISHTNDQTAAFFRGRIRQAPTASIFYLNETGGMGNTFTDNDYLWVLNDYALHEILPRDSAGSPVPDWDLDWRALRPIVTGLRSVYADFVSSATGDKLEIAFSPSIVWAASGSAAHGTTPYQWDIPGGGTITVGSDTDLAITVRFDAGFADWVSLTVMDDNGNSTIFHFHVWACDKASNAPSLVAFDELNVQCEIPIRVNEGASSGYSGSFVAYADVSGLLDQTLLCAWVDQTYNGVAVDIGSAGNIVLCGRLRQENNPTTYDEQGQQDAQVELSIAGPLEQLSDLRFPSLFIEEAASPSGWNEVEDLTVWRAVWLILSEYSTFGGLHSLVFDDTSDDFRYGGFNTQGSDLLYTVADLLQSINAVLMDNAAGQCQAARRGSLLSAADRAGIVSLADWAKTDHHGQSYRRDHFPAVGSLKGAGGGYNTGTTALSAYLVRAPHGAPGPGAGEAQLYRQILVANQTSANEQAELEQRAGDGYAAEQSPQALDIAWPSGYHGLTPDVQQWMSWTIAAADTVRGKAFTSATNWWLQSLRKRYRPGEGTVEVQGRCVIETDGADGEVIDYPAIDLGQFALDLGDLGELIDLPTTSDDTTSYDFTGTNGGFTGNCGAYSGGTGWEEDCCDSQNKVDIEKALGDIYTLKSISVTYSASATLTGAANLIQVKVTGRPYQTVASWTTEAGANQTLTFNLGGIPATHIRVLIYGDDDGCVDTVTLTGLSYTVVTSEASTWSQTFDFTAGDGGWYDRNSLGVSEADYVAGTGWAGICAETPSAPGDFSTRVVIQRDFSARTITTLEMDANGVAGTFAAPVPVTLRLFLGGVEVLDTGFGDFTTGSHTYSWSGSVVADQAELNIWAEAGASCGGSVEVTITRALIEGEGENPIS